MSTEEKNASQTPSSDGGEGRPHDKDLFQSVFRFAGMTAGYSTFAVGKAADAAVASVKTIGTASSAVVSSFGISQKPRQRIRLLQKEIDRLKRRMGEKLAANLLDGLQDPSDDVDVMMNLKAIREKEEEIDELAKELEASNGHPDEGAEEFVTVTEDPSEESPVPEEESVDFMSADEQEPEAEPVAKPARAKSTARTKSASKSKSADRGASTE